MALREPAGARREATRWRRAALVAAGGVVAGAAFLPPVVAIQAGPPPRGARVAIVAYHDSRLLTLCPVFGKQAVVSNLWTSKMAAKVTVAYAPTGLQQYIGLHFDPDGGRRAILPMPAGRLPGGQSGPPPAAAPLELDRLARDNGVERRLADRFRARKAYTVADSPSEADFVLVAESSYIPYALGTAGPSQAYDPKGAGEAGRDSAGRVFSDTESEWSRRMDWRAHESPATAPDRQPPPETSRMTVGVIGGDRHANWRQSILALVVPAAAYRQHAGDGAALSASAVWSGITVAGWGPREQDTRTMSAASPEDLVDQLHAKEAGLPDYLPVCAATAGPIRAIREAGEGEASGPGRSAQNAPPPAAPEQESGRPRFRTAIMLVAVPVTVTDRDGQIVRDLPLSAFHVFEDGAEQKVDRLDPGTTPADVALLIDTSASMRAVREAIRTSAPAVAGALRAADRAMIVSVDSRVRVLAEFTRERPALERALAQPAPGGATRLYDALALIAADRLGEAQGRTAVVLLTDGVDTHSQLTDAAGALAAIESSNIPVFIVRFETGDAGVFGPTGTPGVRRWVIPPESAEQRAETRAEADRFLIRLSAGSGGRLYAARTNASVEEILAHVGDELSNQLILGYYPSNGALDGTHRTISVTVDCPGCAVRARAGYRAGHR